MKCHKRPPTVKLCQSRPNGSVILLSPGYQVWKKFLKVKLFWSRLQGWCCGFLKKRTRGQKVECGACWVEVGGGAYCQQQRRRGCCWHVSCSITDSEYGVEDWPLLEITVGVVSCGASVAQSRSICVIARCVTQYPIYRVTVLFRSSQYLVHRVPTNETS